MQRRVVSFVALCLFASSAPDAANWPAFRGESTSGVAPGTPPLSWNVANGSNIAWKTPIPGVGHSSPIVWGDRVFVTSAIAINGKPAPVVTGVPDAVGIGMADDTGEHEWHLYALDRTTGKIVWDQMAVKGRPRVKHHVKASHASQTPATDGRFVVTLMGSQGLFCYDMDGRQVWKKDLGVMTVGLAGSLDSEWGPGSSPVIAGDRVIVQNDQQEASALVAFDLATGRQMWRAGRDDLPSWSTPLVTRQNDRWVVVTNSPRGIRAYDVATGRELWRYADDAQVKVPSPILSGNYVIVTGGFPASGRPTLAIPIDSAKTVTAKQVAWQIDRGSPYTPTPIVYEGVLYVVTDSGILAAYDATTGSRFYQIRLGGGGAFSASPVAAGGHVYFVGEEGDVYVVRAGKEPDGGQASFGETTFATPAIDGNLIIARTRGHVLAIGKP